MTKTIYDQVRKNRYRVTLELDVLDDFDPQNIDWLKLFKLEADETCEAYIEDLNIEY